MEESERGGLAHYVKQLVGTVSVYYKDHNVYIIGSAHEEQTERYLAVNSVNCK